MADEIKQEVYEAAVNRLAEIKESFTPGKPIPTEQLDDAMAQTKTIGAFIQSKRDNLELDAAFNPGINVEESEARWKEAADTNQKMQDALKNVKEEQLAKPAVAAPVDGDAEGGRDEANQAKGPVLSQNPSLDKINELLTSLVGMIAMMTGTDPDLLTKGPAFVAAKKAEQEAGKDKADDDQQKPVAAAQEATADMIADNKKAELAPVAGAIAADLEQKEEQREGVKPKTGLGYAVLSAAAFAGAATDALSSAAKEGSKERARPDGVETAKAELRDEVERTVERAPQATVADARLAGDAAEASVALSKSGAEVQALVDTVKTGARSSMDAIVGMLTSVGVTGDGQNLTSGMFPSELGQQQVRLPESKAVSGPTQSLPPMPA